MNYTKITISGKICTGKTTLFKNLQHKLDWPSFSTSQYFRQMAKTENLSLESAQEQNDKVTKEVDYKVKDLLKSEGKLIAEGWMTGIMADSFPGILKILLISDDKIRIRRFSRREKITLAEAEERINKRESNLFSKLQQIYRRSDFFDQKNYNLVINTSNKQPTEIVNEVLRALS